MIIYKIIGAIGLGLISIGIITKNRQNQDIFYILGGTCLEIYSFYLKDWIFIFLQLIFTITAIYDLVRLRRM